MGKGHNGGDAVIAAKSLLLGNPALRATLWPLTPETECRPHLRRALQEARRAVGDRMDELCPAGECGDGEGLAETLRAALGEDGFLATVDGLLGMQAKLPLRSPLREWVALLNEEPKLGVRFAVDLPTGLTGDSVESGQILRADFTYCAGIVKSPVLRPDQAERVGRLRYLDLVSSNPPSSWKKSLRIRFFGAAPWKFCAGSGPRSRTSAVSVIFCSLRAPGTTPGPP